MLSGPRAGLPGAGVGPASAGELKSSDQIQSQSDHSGSLTNPLRPDNVVVLAARLEARISMLPAVYAI